MNINKYIIIILIIFLLPFNIKAEECKKDDVVISKIELNEIRGNAEETANPNNDNNQLNLNAKMNVIGDSLTYKVVIKNTSNSDYVFAKNQITKDYINYDISYEDNSNIIKAGEEKIIYLKLKYDSKPQVEALSNGLLQENNLVSFQLINEKGDSLINPETGNKVFFILLFIVLIITVIFIKSNKKITTMLIIISLFIIPQMVKAVCTCSLNINLNLEIDAKEAVFLPGKEVNDKMKQLAGDDTSTVTNAYYFKDELITSIIMSQEVPSDTNKEEKNIVSTPESSYPIYMWFDNGTIYWWSEDKTPSLNEDASYMFYNTRKLNDISGVQSFDVSETKHLTAFFCSCDITSTLPLLMWNTKEANEMTAMFGNNFNLTSVDGLKYWDVSNVNDMLYLFGGCSSLTNISGLGNWDTSNVTVMTQLFTACESLNNIDILANWDTTNLTTTQNMFAYCNSLSDLTPLKNWDVSKVEHMGHMFIHCISLTELSGLENWDTSKVIAMNSMFHNCVNLTDASAIANWDVSNVQYMQYMFNISNDVATTYKYSSLEELDLSKWNMKSVKNYTYFLESYHYVNSEFTIRSTSIENYERMLHDSATKGGHIIVNYTSETEYIIDEIVNTKTNNSNVVKGSLVE